MNPKIINHYLEFSQYTNPGPYLENLKKTLPDNVRDIGLLVRKQLIHKMTLKNGNTGSNADLRYGDMTKVPWYRQSEDDVFPTAVSMLAELYRRDPRGLILDRSTEDRLILTCRSTAILMATLLKIKGIPARVRSGFAPYFVVEGFPIGKSDDHWINQYWNASESRWVTIDVDGSIEGYLKFDPYNIPKGQFDFPADAWLAVRKGSKKGEHFWNVGGNGGLIVIAWALFQDFHCLMNDEVIYSYSPEITWFKNFGKIPEPTLTEIDNLATLMQEPDKNYEEILKIWETKKQFRL